MPKGPVNAPTQARALIALLYGYEPYLVCALDAEWNLTACNYPFEQLMDSAAPELRRPPVNMLRLVLHPLGLAGRLDNLDEVHAHMLGRLRRRLRVAPTDFLIALEREVSGYREVPPSISEDDESPLPFPVRLWIDDTLIGLTSSTIRLGTPWDGSAFGPWLECLLPADEATRDLLFARNRRQNPAPAPANAGAGWWPVTHIRLRPTACNTANPATTRPCSTSHTVPAVVAPSTPVAATTRLRTNQARFMAMTTPTAARLTVGRVAIHRTAIA
jgi:hypothetical protein